MTARQRIMAIRLMEKMEAMGMKDEKTGKCELKDNDGNVIFSVEMKKREQN